MCRDGMVRERCGVFQCPPSLSRQWGEARGRLVVKAVATKGACLFQRITIQQINIVSIWSIKLTKIIATSWTCSDIMFYTTDKKGWKTRKAAGHILQGSG